MKKQLFFFLVMIVAAYASLTLTIIGWEILPEAPATWAVLVGYFFSFVVGYVWRLRNEKVS